MGKPSCRLIQREEYGGVLPPLMVLMFGNSTKCGVDEMNQSVE